MRDLGHPVFSTADMGHLQLGEHDSSRINLAVNQHQFGTAGLPGPTHYF